MKNLLKVALILALACTVAFGMIPRVAEIPMPEDSLNNGGVGEMVAGYDIDQDGKMEIYVVNDNWNDSATEIVPRIYKLEQTDDATDFEVVWSANAQDYQAGIIQNTWPTLAVTDFDDDGKMELTWGIVNNTSGSVAEPYRIWVYEHAGGDNFGIDDGSGKWLPNSVWRIEEGTGKNIRPRSWEIADINDDGIDEIIFGGRTSGMRIGIASVDDIPDNGDGSETWFLEFNSNDVVDYGADNKWDVAVIGNNAYFFDEVKISKVSYDNFNYTYSEMDALKGGYPMDISQVCDVDGDGVEEILMGEYTNYDPYGDGTHNITLLQEEGDTLKRSILFTLDGVEYLNGGNLCGGAHGDIDIDENMDFIFGSRYSGPPNAMIFRVEYLGSGDITDPANWEMTLADTSGEDFASGTSGFWDIIDIANLDDSPELEVVYSSSIPGSAEGTFPLVILDLGDYTGVNGILTPKSFELGQAYPNPFNPSTMIPFTLENTGNVSLDIFNVKGQHVANLVSNEIMEAGLHNVIFDAADLASGVYLYQLRVDNTVRAAKMVLNK